MAQKDARELLEEIAKVTGVLDYPGVLPVSLLGEYDDEEPVSVESTPQYLTWLVKQLDALMGQFPIEIEVKSQEPDPDNPTSYTTKEETVVLRNLSEILAEIYTQGFYLTTTQHAQTNALVRTGTELMAIKTAVAVAQDLIMACNEFGMFRCLFGSLLH